MLLRKHWPYESGPSCGHGRLLLAGGALFFAGCSSGLTPVESAFEPLEASIAGRGLVDVPIPVPANAPTLITVRSDGVDVRATLVDTQGHELGYADAPNRRMGVETLFIEPAAHPPRLLRLAGIDHGKARGRIRIEGSALPDRAPADRRRIEATRLDARACGAYPTFESAEAAAAAFREAAALHTRNRDHLRAGISLLHESGTRYMRHEQYLQAADLAFGARKALDRTGDALLAAYAERLEGAALYAAAGLATGHGRQHEQLVHRGLERLTSAARDLAKLGAHYEAGYAVNYRGVLNQEAGRVADARTDFKEALDLFKKAGDSPAQALSLEGLALLDHNDGRSQDALDSFDAALRLIPAAEEPENYAHALHNSALPRQVLGRFDEAIARYQQAAQILADRHDTLGEARALHGIGATLRLAGYPDRAKELLRTAIRLRGEAGAKREQAVSLIVLGEIERESGNIQAATQLHQQAGDLVSAPHDRARVLLALGKDYLAAENLDAARQSVSELLALNLPQTNRHVAGGWGELGAIEAAAGNELSALAAFDKSIAAHRSTGSNLEGAKMLAQRAQVFARAGHSERVLNDTAAALALLDEIGLRGTQAENRAMFRAAYRELAELRIATLLTKPVESASASALEAALATSDSAHGRLLDDALSNRASRLTPGDRQRRDALYDLVAGKRSRRDKLLEADSPDQAALDRLAADIELLRAEIRTLESAAGASGSASRRTTILHRSSLDPTQLVAEFFIGQERSWLFLTTRDDLSVVVLPRAAEIGQQARQLLHAWRNPNPDRGTTGLAAAAPLIDAVFRRILLPPQVRELILIPDGPLHTVPSVLLARLALADGDQLSISIVPSMRTLAPGGHGARARMPARKLALVADPIFTARDPRLTQSHKDGGDQAIIPVPVADDSDLLSRAAVPTRILERLRSTAIEAQQVMALAGGPTQHGNLYLTGADATRARVIGVGLDDFRILHFATHAWTDSEDPALAGLALSISEHDDSVPSQLRAVDIADLRLNADLVVLSACDTGTGREVPGEGPLALSHAFLRAGARSVLSTLWQVPDTATAALMTEFYTAMLRGHQPAGEALELAQHALQKSSKWVDPYYWASFQLVSTTSPRTTK